MKEFYAFFRHKAINGLLLLLCVTLIVLLLTKLWEGLKAAISNMNEFLGLERWMGVAMLVVCTCIALVLACFLTGIVVHFVSISIFRSWFERKLVKYLPGYLYVQMLIDKKFGARKDGRICVMVNINDVWQPGLLIEENSHCSVVYLPNCPQPDSGITCVVEKEHIKHLKMTIKKFNDSITHFGKGFADAYSDCIAKKPLGEKLPNY